MQTFDYNPTIKVIFGENTIDQLGQLAKVLGAKKALLVSDPGLAKGGHVERAVQCLRRSSLESVVFQGVIENPTTGHVESGVQFAQENGPIDIIIGLGGGSSLDCAKGINFLLTNGGKMEDYWGFGKAKKPMLPAIGIPTTAGTGSEAQSFALIAKEDTHQKMACGDIKARFRTVILDPNLLQTVPRNVAAVTGIDAISHAIESFVSMKRNAFSQMFSKEALKLLSENYRAFISDRQNLAAAGKMLLGAHLAGNAIENSMLGAAHACANPLTAHFDMTHGAAVGLMLPHVIRFNAETVNGFYDELAETAGLKSGAEGLAARITELFEMDHLPVRLRDCHISETELPELAEEAAEQWTGKFNPRPVGETELLELYRQAF